MTARSECSALLAGMEAATARVFVDLGVGAVVLEVTGDDDGRIEVMLAPANAVTLAFALTHAAARLTIGDQS